MNGSEISTVALEKDIGFWISEDLSTATHVQKAKGKAMAEIIWIRRNFSYIDKRAFCTLYNQRIRPHLDYGMAACPPGTSAEAIDIRSHSIEGNGPSHPSAWTEFQKRAGEEEDAGAHDAPATEGTRGPLRGLQDIERNDAHRSGGFLGS